MAKTFDVVVIGAGPGGYIAAIRAAQLGLQDRLHRRLEHARRQAGAGRHLHQRRLHSVQGAAAVVGELTSTPATPSPTTASRSRAWRMDVAQMLARKDKVVQQNNDGILYLFKKNKVDVFPRPRQLRRQGRRRLADQGRRQGAADADRQARDRRHRLQPARAARRAVRQQADPATTPARWRCPRCRRSSASSAPA